jgi:hypothetical protein
MSRQESQAEVNEQTQQLLRGPLKHVRAAALAAALVPLASVAVSPAVAQTLCSGGGIGDYVWSDTNNNGIQDAMEPGIDGAVVSLTGTTDTVPPYEVNLATDTGPDGFYLFFDLCPGTYKVSVQIPNGKQPSPADQGSDDGLDSDGMPEGGNSTVIVKVPTVGIAELTDFGFWTPPVEQPGTGTPGYWKNHPEAWPVSTITVGGVTYTKEEAIAWLSASGPDRTLTMFSSLVPAMLNVMIGNDESCVAGAIDAGDRWMADYGPLGRGVRASSLAWKLGEPIHREMDNYNNGMLCAPHRE